jgi:hypothetical protein
VTKNMDKLTGFQDAEANHEFPSEVEEDSIRFTSNPERKIDNNSILPFLEGGSKNPKHKPSKSNLDLFDIVANLDPTEVSDEEIFQISKQLSNADFVRAVSLAYLQREAPKSEVSRWISDIEGHKDGRRFLLRGLRNSSAFLSLHSHFGELPIIKPIRKSIERLQKLVKKIVGIEHLEILAVKNLAAEQNELLIHACIDKGLVFLDKETSQYVVAGWVLGRDSQPSAIRLLCDGIIVTQVPFILRQDVIRYYCLPSSIKCGYHVSLNIKQLPNRGSLEIQAAFANGTIITVGVIEFRKL